MCWDEHREFQGKELRESARACNCPSLKTSAKEVVSSVIRALPEEEME